jgi:hypothetical protein
VKAARKPAHAQQRNKRAMKRFGPTRWNGDLREGKGAVSTKSRALANIPIASSTPKKRQAVELASEF